MFQNFLDQKYFGNSVLTYLISAAITVSVILIVFLFRLLVIKRLKKAAQKSKTRIDNLLLSTVDRFVIPLGYFGAFYFGLNNLKLYSKAQHVLDSVILVIITFYGIRFFASTINYFIRIYSSRRESSEAADTSLKGVATFVSVIVWGLGLVFLLDNLGFKISTVIATLGIGGIAVALAAQAVLGDFFSYFVIFFDRPFQIGDFIQVDDKMGTVESIGIKTTRVKSLNGEQIIFPNANLTNSRVHNYKRMEQRRIVFKLNIVYQTPYEKIKQVPEIIKSIITAGNYTKFDRCHFSSYSDSGLTFETVYFVTIADYNLFMDIQQNIYLRIYQEFENHSIKFSFPTRIVEGN